MTLNELISRLTQFAVHHPDNGDLPVFGVWGGIDEPISEVNITRLAVEERGVDFVRPGQEADWPIDDQYIQIVIK